MIQTVRCKGSLCLLKNSWGIGGQDRAQQIDKIQQKQHAAGPMVLVPQRESHQQNC